MDFWRAIPSCSERLRSRRRMTPVRPTMDGKPKQTPENGSSEETDKTRRSSLKIQFKMLATQVAIP